MSAEPEESEQRRPPEPEPRGSRRRALLRNAVTLVVWAGGGFVTGGIVGLIVVAETDPEAAHAGLNAAIVLLLASAGALASLGLVLGPLGRWRPPGEESAAPPDELPHEDGA